MGVTEWPPGWEPVMAFGLRASDIEDEDLRLRRIGSDDVEGVTVQEAWRIYRQNGEK
jgi:hypothetical protein